MMWQERMFEIKRSDSVASKAPKHFVALIISAVLFRAKESKSALIIRCDNIGDFTLWIDAARRLVAHYRNDGLHVTLLANAEWAEFAAELGLFDSVVAVDLKRFSKHLGYRLSLAKRLRSVGFSVALLAMYSRTFMIDMMLHLSGARERIGWSGDFSNIDPEETRVSDGWYTQLITARPGTMMEAFRNADLVSRITGQIYTPQLVNWSDFPMLSKMNGPLDGVPKQEPYYVLQPSASWDKKRWPLENFAEIANFIWRQTGWRGVICGGIDDLALADRLCSTSAAPLKSLAGQTTISQLVVLISRSRLLLSNDTAAAHIGAAAGIPTICICGGWHYGRFWPYPEDLTKNRVSPKVATHKMPCFGCNWECPHTVSPGEPVPCIGRISVGDVISAARTILSESNSAPERE